MSSITIKAASGTDIWRKPPKTDIFNVSASRTGPSTGALIDFVSAKASFSFLWREQYDQAGLLFSLRKPAQPDADPGCPPPKWIKTGIEFYNGKPMLSTVACDAWADWSVAPLELAGADTDGRMWTTLSVEKEGDEHGASLWVYRIMDDGAKVPLREVCWVFGQDPDSWELEVLAVAARPEKGVEEDLEVTVKDMEVKWKT